VIESISRDARLAWRALMRTPGFTTAAVLTMGVGMGGTVLMLTAANAAFRQPLAFGHADRLVHIWQVSARSNQIAIPLVVARDWESAAQSLDSVALALGAGSVNISNGADAERAVRGMVSRSLFSTLGVQPIRGRTFSEEEAATNGPLAVVISDGLWERLFARTPDVLSRTVQIEGIPHPVVGVMPAGFSYPVGADLWTTFERSGPDGYGGRTAHNFEVIARLADGVTIAQAQAEIEHITRGLHNIDAAMRKEGHGVRLSDLRADLLGAGGPALLLLTAAVGCVLLIACVNVANLLLSRAVTREAQSTLRVALGATSRDLLRLFLVESVLIAAAGSAVGSVLVTLSSGIARGLLPAGLASDAIQPDLIVLLVCGVLMLAAGVACGLPASLHCARLDLRSSLSGASRAVVREPRGMSVLTASEVAIACVLLVGAGILVRSLSKLEVVDPGFESGNVLVSTFSLGAAPGSRYAEPEARARFLDVLVDRARAVPGVERVGVTSSLPFAFSPNARPEEEGVGPGEREPGPSTHYRVIGGDYFQALQIPLRAGRFFDARDRAGAPHVVIVNETLAARMWGGGDALGRRLRMRNMDGLEQFATVVGVVADIRHRALTQPAVAEVFFPYAQRPVRTFSTGLVVRTRMAPESAVAGLRGAVREADPGMSSSFVGLADRVDVLVAPARFRTRLLAAFALVALLLAAVGLFAVVSYGVARRTREIGIRMALGADARQVQRMVIARSMTPVLVGTIAGAWTAVLLGRFVAGLVFEVSPRDPVAYSISILTLPLVGLAATWLPARRATRVDPTAALRAE
jgi:predicted permease